MKRALSALVAAGLVAAVAAGPAGAKPKAVSTTLYFHGTETAGEVDLANNFAATYNKMDSNKPTDAAPKSQEWTTWGGPPPLWNDCAGSYLLPVWTTPFTGRVVGDLKVTINTVSAPKSVKIQVWGDVGTQTCASNDFGEGDYPAPAAEATVDIPAGPGETTATIKHVNFKVQNLLMVQIQPQGPAPGRILYDSPDYDSRVELTCVPAKGSKTCAP